MRTPSMPIYGLSEIGAEADVADPAGVSGDAGAGDWGGDGRVGGHRGERGRYGCHGVPPRSPRPRPRPGWRRAGIDRRFDRHAWPHQGPERVIPVEDDLHRNALNHLGEVAGRVVGRKQRKSASRSRRPALHMPGKLEIGEGVDGDPSRLADPDAGHLGFLVICDHPDVGQWHDSDDLRSDIDELAEPDLPLADQAIRRRHDARIAQVVGGERDLRLGRVDLRLELLFLDVDRRKRRLLLVELSCVQTPLGDGPLGVVVGLLDQLLRAGDPGAQEVALALVLELIAQDVGLGGVDRRFGLLDKRLLHDPLIGEIGERRLGGGEIGLRQLELSLVVGRVDHCEKVALAHDLEVVDRHFGDVPGHTGRERRHISRYERVVGRFRTGPRRSSGPNVRPCTR